MTTDALKRPWQALLGWIGRLDGQLIVIFAAFLAVALCIGLLLAPPVVDTDPVHVMYEDAIAQAAVTRPSYAVKLKTIPASQKTVNVVVFGPAQDVSPKSREVELWVYLPEELRAACKGAKDPVRRLQQILGMPPVAVPGHVIQELQVERAGLIRPCLAGGDLSSPHCSLEMPPTPPVANVSAPVVAAGGGTSIGGAGGSAALAGAGGGTAAVAGSGGSSTTPGAGGASGMGGGAVGGGGLPSAETVALNDLYFLTKQMWSTHRRDFPSKVTSGDYPYTGLPFTGMGWTFDWSDVPNHIGVSEFAVKRNAPVTAIAKQTPAEFCAP